MANPAFKEESYSNFGGLNIKTSLYLTNMIEFLGLVNYDFQTPGAITQRWGSTQYLGQTFPFEINTLFEYSKTTGFSQLIVGHSGGVWFGNSQISLVGMSFTVSGVTQVAGVISIGLVGFYYTGQFGPPFFNFKESPITVADPTGAYLLGTGATVYVDPFLLDDNKMSLKVQNNFLFMADANKFSKFDGVTTTIVSLPPVARVFPSGTLNGGGSSGALFGASVFLTNSISLPVWPTGGTIGIGGSGIFYCYMTYVNNRGFEGPLSPIALINTFSPGGTFLDSGTYLSFAVEIATPLQYGISSINQYVYYATNSEFTTPLLGVNEQVPTIGATVSPLIFSPVLISNTPASGTTFTWVQTGLGASLQGASFIALTGNLGTFYNDNGYLPINGTFVVSQDGLIQKQTQYDLTNYYPSYLEVYANTLFAAGFSATPSTVWFSDVTEPEGFDPDFNFEVRTNDGDVVTALKSYSTRLCIFKLNSFHVLTGDNPQNYFIQEASDIYGCVNNYCVVTFENTMLFLDSKGIINYNGASIDDKFSFKVQPFFDRMNIAAARKVARMYYDKIRNQVFISIPVDGAIFNNLTIVYDNALSAWTTYQGFTPTMYATIQGTNLQRYPFYGDGAGRVNMMGPSFMTDNGATVSLYFKSRFMHELGQSVEKQYRRLYLNADPLGATLVIPINFYQDYGASIVMSATLALGQFQDRIDYGIPAKSLALESTIPGSSGIDPFSGVGYTAPVRIYGFTVQERLQRNT